MMMKNQIDNLVRGILHDLTQSEPAQPELAIYMVSIGADGHTRAVTQRDILATWIEDMKFSSEVRQYAQQRFDGLPPF
jgi:hypothetical protein